ncbi:hypothetical protein EXS74_00645 [Candidatus Woesearchaeota archaeon]|nr:hypothetical protein [Candidatus Woesearchaeota archaeon]
MVHFSPREKYTEVQETSSENAEGDEQITIEERVRREEQEKGQVKPRLEQQIQIEAVEPKNDQEPFSYQTSVGQTTYGTIENPMDTFWEEKKIADLRGEEERRKRNLL